jgi:chromosome partitioning protein
MSAQIIVFANQKGGVGKTTTAVNLGAFMAEAGKRILLVDFDPQGNLSSSVGSDHNRAGIYEVLAEKSTAEAALQTTGVENLTVLSSDINLSALNVELIDAEDKEYYLKDILDPLRPNYDYIFIDCPPSLGVLTLNGLAAADKVIIPMQCEYFALEGMTLLLRTIKSVQEGVNKDLQLGGIVFTMYDSRTNLANEVVQEVTSYFKDKVFRSIIPRNVKLSEAPSHGVPISKYDRSCQGALSYKNLAVEVIARG